MKPLPFKLRQETDLEKWRAETFWTKEPETIAWIDSFKPGETFLDIGANIGIYSLYAAKRGVSVVAIEPHYPSYTALCINARLNSLRHSIRTIRALVQEQVETVRFFSGSQEAGFSGTRESHNSTACYVEEWVTPVPAFSVDWLTDAFGAFNHIKIDVDGEEDRVVDGMCFCLLAQNFDSCLVEVEEGKEGLIMAKFFDAGYTTNNPFNTMTPHSRDRRAKEGITVENIVFTRSNLPS